MGLHAIRNSIQRGVRGAGKFLGRASHGGMKFALELDEDSGMAKGALGAVAPMVGELAGPVGGAVGAAVGAGMKGLGAYDRLTIRGDEPGEHGRQRRRRDKTRHN